MQALEAFVKRGEELLMREEYGHGTVEVATVEMDEEEKLPDKLAKRWGAARREHN